MYKRVVITLIAILLAACACFIGIHEYLRRTEIEQKEKLMHIALAQKQAELMLQEEDVLFLFRALRLILRSTWWWLP